MAITMTKDHHKDITSKEELDRRLMQLEIYIHPKKLEPEDIDASLKNLVLKYYETWENYRNIRDS
ncbi:MAG: hypothetical protein COA79_06665 [Planctomycetota bacterium]|nr:MAG: hypothetical protein COA79_06665 [Planctomycetota bacterium]